MKMIMMKMIEIYLGRISYVNLASFILLLFVSYLPLIVKGINGLKELQVSHRASLSNFTSGRFSNTREHDGPE